MENKEQTKKTKAFIDIGDQLKEKKGKYFMNKIASIYYNQTAKTKTYIKGGAVAALAFALYLSPMGGGYDYWKHKFTKPIVQQLNTIKEENKTLSKDKKEMKKTLDKYKGVEKILKKQFNFDVTKQSSSDLEKMVREDFQDPQILREVLMHYNPNMIYLVKINSDKKFFIATYALDQGKPVDLSENPENLTNFAAMCIWDKDFRQNLEGDNAKQWAKYQLDYKKGKVDIVSDFEICGSAIMVGKWANKEDFEVIEEIKLNKSEDNKFVNIYTSFVKKR